MTLPEAEAFVEILYPDARKAVATTYKSLRRKRWKHP